SFELVVLIDVGCPEMPINGDHHRQTDRSLCCRDCNREDCDHHPGWWMRRRRETPERDEIQVRGREHHFDADQNKNRVSPTERREQADRKQGGRNDQETLQCRCHEPVFFAYCRSAPADRKFSLSHRQQTARRRSSFPQNAETSTV